MASSHSSDSFSDLASGFGKETNRSHSSILDVALVEFTGRRFTLSVSTTSMKASGFLWENEENDFACYFIQILVVGHGGHKFLLSHRYLLVTNSNWSISNPSIVVAYNCVGEVAP